MSHPALAVDQEQARRSISSRVRHVALCACYAFLSLWALVMTFYGTVLLVSGGLPDRSWAFGALAAAAFKALTLGSALVILVTRGRSVQAVRVLAIGQAVWLAADLIAPQESVSVVEVTARAAVSLVMWVGPWVLLAEQRSRLWRDRLTVRPRLFALSLLAVLLCVPWALATARLDVSQQTSVGSTAELRYDVAGCAISLVAALVLCAMTLAPWWDRMVAAALICVGLASVTFPSGYGSPGYVGGLFIILAGALLWVSRWGARHA